MRKISRINAVFTAAVMAGLILAGCGNTAGTAETAASAEQTEAAETAEAEKAELPAAPYFTKGVYVSFSAEAENPGKDLFLCIY